MATNSTVKKKNTVSAGSSNKKTAAELREWYNKYGKAIEVYERSKEALQLLDPTKTSTRTFSTFSKDLLRTYMQNPLSQYKNLRGLSRFLYYRSHSYKRIINYNATMINLNYRSVIPKIDFVKGADAENVKKSYFETLKLLDGMNLNLEFLKAYITCWREDVFFGCAYMDEDAFFILPLDPDYCKITGIYNNGSFAFDMDMSYFSRRQEILEMWGEPFVSMYNEYQKDTTNGRWQPFDDEHAVCLKVNVDDYEIPLPPYLAMFNNLINLEDLAEITAIADEQQIYKLLVAEIPLLSGSKEPNDFAIDLELIIDFYNKIKGTLPDYTNAILSLTPIETITFDHDQTTDVNKLENATKTIFNSSGGAQILSSSSISGSTGLNMAMKVDEENALSALLPQTEAIVNRLISYQIKDAAKVKFHKVTKYTLNDFRTQVKEAATYGLPVKLLLNSLNEFSELDTMAMNFLENDCLELHKKFIPLQSSNTMNTGDLISEDGGAPTKSDEEISDDGEASRDKRDSSG